MRTMRTVRALCKAVEACEWYVKNGFGLETHEEEAAALVVAWSAFVDECEPDSITEEIARQAKALRSLRSVLDIVSDPSESFLRSLRYEETAALARYAKAIVLAWQAAGPSTADRGPDSTSHNLADIANDDSAPEVVGGAEILTAAGG